MKKDPLAPIREQLTATPTHWRSLEHKSGDGSVIDSLDVEFPSGTMTPTGFNRRDALKLAGASVALASFAGCIRRPEQEILPFNQAPEAVIPGVRLLYATAMQRSEGAVGLTVEAHDGRPTKIEGNPNHPSSLGGSDVWAQAEILKLYDPDRSRSPRRAGQPATWEAWDAFAKETFSKHSEQKGKGLAFVVEEDCGPTFERLLALASSQLPEAKIFRFDPLAPDAALEGAQLAFGPGARARYDLDKCKIIFALDSDFLNAGPDHLRLARQFGKNRGLLKNDDALKMNRLYVAEGVYSTTGANADHRLRIASARGATLLKAIAHELATKHGVDLGELSTAASDADAGDAKKFVAALAKDLAAARGASLVIVGDRQPPAVHAFALALNVALRAHETAILKVSRRSDAAPRVSHSASLENLTKSLNDGQVQTLVLIDTNPLYSAPGALKFGEALGKATTVIHAGVLPEETGDQATWHLPTAHFLESWGDAQAWDGTASVVQPLILPLHGSRPAISLLAQMLSYPETADKKLVEETWRAPGRPLVEMKAWRKALHDGVIEKTAWMPTEALPRQTQIISAMSALMPLTPNKDALELVAMTGHLIDGRLSNVSWVQELPDSMTKLCWDNALIMSPALAKELGVQSAVKKNSYVADVADVSVNGRSIRAPIFVLPGMAPHTVAMTKGFGKKFGSVGQGVGVNVNPLLADSTGVVQGVKLTLTGTTQILCSTQDHFSVPGNPLKEMTFAEMSVAQGAERTMGLANRNLYRSGSAAEFEKDPSKVARTGDMPASLVELKTPKTHPSRPIQPTTAIVYEGQQWGMVFDLSSCIGCSVCTIACTAENNIPTVGREQVLLGRELHWIRVDRYFVGDVDEPAAAHQPLACAHCENAPCEPVCPVAATVHDEEGINTMAYNRCIGTRYCANNCPFKVRRFNYLDFTHSGDYYVEPKAKERMKTLSLQRNPDVTVRYRGTMEKCTLCTQRIEEAKIVAKRAGGDRKALPDGAVVPACVQACPTQAITFGNINDPSSKVAQLKASDRNYEMLQELNIRPRTTFLANLKNRNEELS